MEQSTNDFRYRPLRSPEVRVVLIQPGPFSSPIHCSLQHVLFNGIEKFEALSYVWGDLKDIVVIDLEGYSFNVTRNLSCALQHLRFEDTTRAFWLMPFAYMSIDTERNTTAT